jgi:hypothetical protein
MNKQIKMIKYGAFVSVPENFRYLIASEIRKANKATADEIAAQLAFIPDDEAINLLMAYYPDEAGRVFDIR